LIQCNISTNTIISKAVLSDTTNNFAFCSEVCLEIVLSVVMGIPDCQSQHAEQNSEDLLANHGEGVGGTNDDEDKPKTEEKVPEFYN
jgi:hypothetical protein